MSGPTPASAPGPSGPPAVEHRSIARAGLPWSRVGLGTLLHVVISGAVAGVARLQWGSQVGSAWWWLVVALVALAGPFVGGAVAGWHRFDGPRVGALAAGFGALALAVMTLARRSYLAQGVPVVSLLGVMAVQVALGVFGGMLGRHRLPNG